jgi:hypothetical protein
MKILAVLFLTFFPVLMFPQKECGIINPAFAMGESLEYKVIYNWGMVWLESGFASFTVNESFLNGKRCYFFHGKGSSYPKYDWFYKVRDNFEVHLDSATLRPLKFQADILEGKKHDRHTYLFNNRTNKVFTIINRGIKPVEIDTLNANSCSVDVLTAIYYARSIDYSSCKINDTIGISIILDGKLYGIYVRYLGKTVYHSKELGHYNCIKFSPLLVEGTIFKEGEGMTVTVTNDENKIPLYIETPILVGTVKVFLTSFKGLRYPLNSKIPETPVRKKVKSQPK